MNHTSSVIEQRIVLGTALLGMNYGIADTIWQPSRRVTVDYPEDLVLCRAPVYSHFADKAPRIPLEDIIAFLDQNPQLKALVDPFVADGLKTMHM